MAEDDERLKAYKADIQRRLDALRIPPSRVAIAYQQDLQDYSVLITGRRLRPKQIEGLVQTVAPILYVEFDKGESAALRERWSELDIPVPLKVISSPYRELVRPVVRYVKEIRKSSPRDVVTVYIPEYVVGRWWEQLLHNQTALRLKGRLLFMQGVMVTSVPYQLRSAGTAKLREERPAPGDVRRGVRGPQ